MWSIDVVLISIDLSTLLGRVMRCEEVLANFDSREVAAVRIQALSALALALRN
jgi:hypothetical protein